MWLVNFVGKDLYYNKKKVYTQWTTWYRRQQKWMTKYKLFCVVLLTLYILFINGKLLTLSKYIGSDLQCCLESMPSSPWLPDNSRLPDTRVRVLWSPSILQKEIAMRFYYVAYITIFGLINKMCNRSALNQLFIAAQTLWIIWTHSS